MAATESISEMQTPAIKEFIGKWPKADRFKISFRLLTKASKKSSDLFLFPAILPLLLFRFVGHQKKPVQSDF
jgi:hypothetical protein